MVCKKNDIVVEAYSPIAHGEADRISEVLRIAEKYNKRSWIPLLKTWFGIQIMYERQPYTINDLKRVTGLSDYQIRTSNQILKESHIYITSRAYNCYCRCMGSYVDLNASAFYKVK